MLDKKEIDNFAATINKKEYVKNKVLKPNGQWSEHIYGLDKIRLMKSAIQYEFSYTNYWVYRYDGRDDIDNDYSLQELEVDGEEISARVMDEFPVNDSMIIWRFFETDLTKVKFLKMRLSTLKEMTKNATYLAPVYNALIDAAEIPTPTPEGYCLTFKFEAQ